MDLHAIDATLSLYTQVPSLDLGGKCVAGSTILVKPALDTKGNLVGPDAVNPKYGTPKCEFHCQLAKLPGGGWVGAHPSLGERAAVALLQRSPVLGDVWTGARAKAEIRREVTGPRGQDMRADFVIGGSDKDCVLEVKTVVDASVDGIVAEEEESGPMWRVVRRGRRRARSRQARRPWRSGRKSATEAETGKSVLVSRNLRLRRREKQKPTTAEMLTVGGVGAAMFSSE